MSDLESLFANNLRWAEDIKHKDPSFFANLAQQQAPEYLWIGCSDSRVPANQIVDLAPGELFVHRNVANVVIHTDLNCLTVLNYAVEFLKVKHVMVTGHYGCGGVKAALENRKLGLIDYWLRNIRDVYYNNKTEMEQIRDEEHRLNRLCELNVIQQVYNVARCNIVQNAWGRGQELTIHGWIYDINDGILHRLMEPIDHLEQIPEQYRLY
ncbi:carbonate dehydratase [Cellvibrio japonicus]|uniref:Carbonic anhydrase 2 n=1 Tax=Cellvibrio japonicus (strain Ueda107) TaxID=498211 RepID=B3PLL8_CELJU|nr:carbonate dehydratase [Cellvibrio japonicus]ACE85936.1 carbonic anhydrase [Cellvibrio japonicus Ueda107]QEI13005.1 carbonate dehydratase [Cellvibrio japonicus]QEI16579.1 carbonate dehydratase [Cellvibrio japonicus]QEI20157.1 carbonate dehydratase [Cellvibrio japonicus]